MKQQLWEHWKKELTPELADKIWKSVQQRNYDNKVSKEAVLHNLKQLKAQMGKYKKALLNNDGEDSESYKDMACAVQYCMSMIDSKIAKVNKQ